MTRALLPLALGAFIALMPVPRGLSPNAWHYFALFMAIITGVMTEPIPAAVLGLIGVTIAAVLGLVRSTPAESVSWALSGFANSTVWLIFAAYMFAMGYSKTGLGKRSALHLIRLMGRRTIGLGYAIMLADLALAPFTPSATARSGGTIYPIARHIPELYGSSPEQGSARKLGAYLLFTGLASSMVTSSMFITALAPNALASAIITRAAHITISWSDWLKGFAPVGITLLLILPAIVYKIYPPELKEAPEAPRWAAEQLAAMGPITRKEITLLFLVCSAVATWIAGPKYIDPTLVAMVIVLLMVLTNLVTWNDVIGNANAWNMLVWFATLVTLAGGLAETKLVDWITQSIVPRLLGLGPYSMIIGLVGSFYFLHYLFASITAHTAALLPVFYAVAIKLPIMSPTAWALLLGYPLGLLGILTPYASGQAAIYFGSGYVTRKDFWVLGAILGVVFFVVYMIIILPWLAFLKV